MRKNNNNLKILYWKVNDLSYRHIFNNIISIFNPDTTHALAIKYNNSIGSLRIARRLTERIFKHDNLSLKQNYFGINFNTPLGVAAGYDKNGKSLPLIANLDFGFYTIGSVTAKQCAGNKKPHIYRLQNSKALVVNSGLCNDGSEVIINRLNEYSSMLPKQYPIKISIAKTNSPDVVSINDGINDYITTLRLAKIESVIKIIELNISCPNAYGGESFSFPESLDLLLSAVNKEKVEKPIFIKMPADISWNKFKDLLDVITKHNITGVTIANLTKNRANISSKDNLPENIRGYLSGKPTYELSNNLINKTYLEYGDKLLIIGVGGIFSADDAYTKIKLGASLVEITTSLMLYGPQLPSEINEGLLKLLKDDKYINISEAIGVDTKKKDQ